ncbi:MAG: hypothetical protein ABF636_04855 [Acetobacter sp.]
MDHLPHHGKCHSMMDVAAPPDNAATHTADFPPRQAHTCHCSPLPYRQTYHPPPSLVANTHRLWPVHSRNGGTGL